MALAQPVSLIPDYGAYGAYTTLAGSPKRVEIDWSQMVQPGWSQMQVPMNLLEVDSIQFTIDGPATAFQIAIANLRLLPTGAAGDVGAVPLTAGTWTASCASGSTCSLAQTGPMTWVESRSERSSGSNTLVAPVPSNLLDFTVYRGLAFDLTATASRCYAYYDFVEIDDGPDAAPGCGATLPFPPARGRPAQATLLRSPAARSLGLLVAWRVERLPSTRRELDICAGSSARGRQLRWLRIVTAGSTRQNRKRIDLCQIQFREAPSRWTIGVLSMNPALTSNGSGGHTETCAETYISFQG